MINFNGNVSTPVDTSGFVSLSTFNNKITELQNKIPSGYLISKSLYIADTTSLASQFTFTMGSITDTTKRRIAYSNDATWPIIDNVSVKGLYTMYWYGNDDAFNLAIDLVVPDGSTMQLFRDGSSMTELNNAGFGGTNFKTSNIATSGTYKGKLRLDFNSNMNLNSFYLYGHMIFAIA